MQANQAKENSQKWIKYSPINNISKLRTYILAPILTFDFDPITRSHHRQPTRVYYSLKQSEMKQQQ